MSPVSMRISVVLPAPFWPSRPWITPRSTLRSTSSQARTGPNRFESPTSCTAGTGVALVRSPVPSVSPVPSGSAIRMACAQPPTSFATSTLSAPMSEISWANVSSCAGVGLQMTTLSSGWRPG